PTALKPSACDLARMALTLVPDVVFQLWMKWAWLPNSISSSQMIMPSHTMANVITMYLATTRTPKIIRIVNAAVRMVAMIIISPLLGEVSALACQPPTYAAAGPITDSM